MRPGSGGDRRGEWYVPRFGPERFRLAVGLLFPPYTGMVLAFALMGSLAAGPWHWDRAAAIAVIYLLGLGVAAHALDALGSRGVKPWGAVFSRRALWSLAAASLVAAYGLAAWYIVRHAPWLAVVAVLEGFFVFAYNLEWLGGRFHTDGWFAFSWGFLPVMAGCLIQAGTVTPAAVLLGLATALLSLVEIKASRPYKELRRQPETTPEEAELLARYETILKCVSLGVILLAAAWLWARVAG